MIKVFNATDKNYATHGDLILQPSKAVVHKEDNGEFYLDLETSLNEKEYKNTTPEAGETIEGTNFSIEVDTTKQYQVQTLKGQTSQSGTPTPTNPVPINITTGRQEIDIRQGKNLIIPEKTYIGKMISTTLNEPLKLENNDAWTTIIDYIPVEYGKTYVMSRSENGNGQFVFAQFDENKNMIARDNRALYTTNYLSYTINNQNTKYLMVGYREDYAHDNIQLEEGTTPTNYEQPKNKMYEINLGKNLFDIGTDKNDYEVTGATTAPSWITSIENNVLTLTIQGSGGTIAYRKQKFDGNKSYTISSIFSRNNGRYYIRLRKKDNSDWLTNNDTTISGWVYNAYYRGWYREFTKTNVDITTDIPDCLYWQLGIGYASVDIGTSQTISNIQLEKGSVATSYSPYFPFFVLGTLPNTNYQNYIFKNVKENPYYNEDLIEGQWYIHKEIGRVVLNGSENWWANGDTTNYGQYAMNLTDKGFGVSNLISSHFITGLSNQKNCIAGRSNNNVIAITIEKSIVAYNTNTFKTWLSTNNVEVCYGLATPTNTLIEDEELINQLNAIELLEGLNNVSVSSANLAGILQLKYNFTTAYSNTIKYIDYLVPNNILVANTPQGDQAFRITNIEKTRRKIKLRANHVFYDSLNYLIADSYVVDKNCNDALDHLNNATSDLSPFTTISDITNINSFRCVRKSLYEAIKVVLERWGGHLVRNDWTIGIYNEIGQDNGVTIRYAKNLKDISATYDWNDVVTKILPVGKDGILLNDLDDEQPLYIESTVQYDIPYTKSVSFEQNDINEDDYKDEDGNLDEERYKQALIDDLYNQAAAYVSENSVPKVNYNLSANVEKVSDVGDRIEVIDEKLGINLMTRIISFDYDCILEKYTNIEFGNFMPKLSDLMSNITASTEQLIQEQNSTLAITLNRELTDATDKIWNALGNSYVIYDGDKILIVDSLPKETARNVIMLNNGGIGFSNNGINGTFNSAWTIDNVLNMEQINVINLTADLIKGGTLKLGSSLNQNGQLEVYDEANNLLAVLNKNGLRMNGADGSYVIMNNDVGFAGFDRLDNKIYWVDKDVFHQKKSEVEEEITLVKKMRILPITITDSQNNIVNDGIGFVNVGGGN
ncbi:MAG: phage tail protein [Bacilli bacterium]|nr:phage tail protein [Bacilli bacterium]